jgi:hypothetical protein
LLAEASERESPPEKKETDQHCFFPVISDLGPDPIACLPKTRRIVCSRRRVAASRNIFELIKATNVPTKASRSSAYDTASKIDKHPGYYQYYHLSPEDLTRVHCESTVVSHKFDSFTQETS